MPKPITFEDLEVGQICKYIYTEEMESDVVYAIRTAGSIRDIYSARGAMLREVLTTSELIKRRYTFETACETLFIDIPEEYPELEI